MSRRSTQRSAAVQRGDWVTTRFGGRGIVRRVSIDGTWADVRFRDATTEWSKRMPVASLVVMTEIEVAGVLVREI